MADKLPDSVWSQLTTHQQSLGCGQSPPVLVRRLDHQLEGGAGLAEEAGGGDDVPGVGVNLEPVENIF